MAIRGHSTAPPALQAIEKSVAAGLGHEVIHKAAFALNHRARGVRTRYRLAQRVIVLKLRAATAAALLRDVEVVVDHDQGVPARHETAAQSGRELFGWGLGSKLRRVVDIGRQ